MTHLEKIESNKKDLSYKEEIYTDRINSCKKILFIFKGIGLKLKRNILTFNPIPNDRISRN